MRVPGFSSLFSFGMSRTFSDGIWVHDVQTGEVLALPEGDEAARAAMLRFARMDQQTQLLGRGFVRFDMRIPGKFIVRVSSQPGTIIKDPPPPPAPAPGQTGSVDPTTVI